MNMQKYCFCVIPIIILLLSIPTYSESYNTNMPLSFGKYWEMKDDLGTMIIRVAGKEQIGDCDCFKIDWETYGSTYQSEYWQNTDEGIKVVGRKVFGKNIKFDNPYLLLKNNLVVDDSWQQTISMGSAKQVLNFKVEAYEKVSTHR